MSKIESAQNILWPVLWLLSLPYRLGVMLRNAAYSKGWLDMHRFPVKIVSVGNLEAGGTGKTPHVEWLIEKLGMHYKIGVVSRGYGRKSHGVVDVRTNETSAKIGDEPLQIHLKYPEMPLVVAEKRAEGIAFMLKKYADTQLIILDDAFQHRAVWRDADILLTRENRLFTNDRMIPAGRLREPRVNRKRAQFVICTHTTKPDDRTHRLRIKKNLRLALGQSLFFSSMDMSMPYPLKMLVHGEAENETYAPDAAAISVAGIAHPKNFHTLMEKRHKSVEALSYPDHHAYTPEDIEHITIRYHQLPENGRVIAITEKDAVKWAELYDDCGLDEYPVWVWPIKVKMTEDDETDLLNKLLALLNKAN